MLRPFLVIGIFSAATGACADPRPLSGDTLKGLAGSLVEIDTPLGTKLPVRFGSDGLVSAEAGELAPLLGAPKDRGRWWVDGDRLCTKWFRWFDAEARCITVAQDGTRLFWRKDDGETGTATLIEAPDAKSEPAVIAEVAVVPDASAPKTSDDGATRGTAAQAPSAESVVPPQPSAAPEPAVVAEAAAASAPVEPKEPIDDGKMMRFGGDGLLEASTRVSGETPAASTGIKTAALTPPAAPSSDGGSIDDKLSPLRREQRTARAEAPAKSHQPVKPKAPEFVKAGVASGAAAKAPLGKPKVSDTPSARPVSLYRVYGVHRYDVLNVRGGPSEDYEPIAAIPPTGRRVEITGRCRDDWCPIRYGTVRGWVNSYYLVAEAPAGSSSQSQVYFAEP